MGFFDFLRKKGAGKARLNPDSEMYNTGESTLGVHGVEMAYLKYSGFTGKKNTKSIVLAKANLLAQHTSSLMADALQDMQNNEVSKAKVQISDKTWWFVYYDLLLYMMHIADREAFAYLEEAKRHIFMKQLLYVVMDICTEDFSDKSVVEDFRENFKRNYNLFQREFASFERGQTEYITSDLTYMFATRITKRLGLDQDLITTLKLYPLLLELEVYLNIPGLLDDSH